MFFNRYDLDVIKLALDFKNSTEASLSEEEQEIEEETEEEEREESIEEEENIDELEEESIEEEENTEELEEEIESLEDYYASLTIDEEESIEELEEEIESIEDYYASLVIDEEESIEELEVEDDFEEECYEILDEENVQEQEIAEETQIEFTSKDREERAYTDIQEVTPTKETNLSDTYEPLDKQLNYNTTERQNKNYDDMGIDELYGEVRVFLEQNGVSVKPVDISLLENTFGKHNIKKLIMKNYLILLKNGVTTGR